ncbi:MAG: Chorismate synthase [Parcubacteria group bacterium GW2011_GWA2_44_12]|nr:MAG: Chorismate synthase [Parcubacteria group bacterium GW2011_GWA2_44_12]
MPGNSFGQLFRITTWGESHGPALGVVVDGCPAGLKLSSSDIQRELDRRRPGQSEIVSPRNERDEVHILSGVFEKKTLGTPIALVIYNKDAQSKDYRNLKDIFRPGHADFTWESKYGHRDYRGGGRASARETIARVAAGAIARKILQEYAGIEIVGFTRQVGDIAADVGSFSLMSASALRRRVEANAVRCPDAKAAKKMEDFILKVKEEGDSIGGVVEVIAKGMPIGLGEPVFNKLPADLAYALMSLPAVKGFEIGDGFAAVKSKGSENNDVFEYANEKFSAKTNHAGGTLGGISSGLDLIVRIAIKPASSIKKEQETVTKQGEKTRISVEGRHDPCLCPRAVPIAEAMVALVLIDHWLRMKTSRL